MTTTYLEENRTMTWKLSLRIAFSALLLGFSGVACASTAGDGSESHFSHCKTNTDCDSGRCEAGVCARPQPRPDAGKDARAHSADATPDGPLADATPDAPDSVPPTELPPVQPANCVLSSTSSLPHVHIEFPSQPCAFTLRQAKAGIRFHYDVVIDQDEPGYTSRDDLLLRGGPFNNGVLMYRELAVAGLEVAVVIDGRNQHYCLCDQGGPPPFCALEDGGFSTNPNSQNRCSPIILKKGVYRESWPTLVDGGLVPIAWDGRNWEGPSDTVNPEGAPFPPGDYALKVAIAGQIANDSGAIDVDVNAEMLIRLVP
jgi:hypothetical protein